MLEVPAAGRYTVKLVNTGATSHDITFPSGETALAKPGETGSVDVDVPAAGLTFLCSIPGHAQAGMAGKVMVAGAAAPSSAPDDHGGPAPATDIQADPNAPAPVRYDPKAPALLAGTVHDIDLVMTEQDMTVATGFVQKVWTFGGTVPGPGGPRQGGRQDPRPPQEPRRGTRWRHSIDFHASQVAWNDEMASIEARARRSSTNGPADYAGVWMYHCGTAPALHHIANGMYGMVIVEPTDGLPKVDNEFALVQSEWYLGPQRQPVDLDEGGGRRPGP